ncbi:hypothetical protein RB608_10300 [Nocardioides sp. LHD-245]|uniref:hypothetical protein n=1 Tax=Nocardioides sp. LHD-245 TaxID=3051387 RepID=UPI0027E1E071|nr:hypothetical protein [Nocardioides sp. LHD-245]
MIPTLTGKPGYQPDRLWEAEAVARDAALRKREPKLPPCTIAPWQPEPLLVMDKGSPWILLPYDKDPLRTRDGGYPFPREVKRTLAAIAHKGVDFDSLAVAHELDPKGPVAPLLGKIPPEGVRCDEAAARELIGKTPAAEGHKRMAATLNRAGDAAAEYGPAALLGLALAPVAIVAAPIALLAAAASGIDPIVFGVLHVEPKAKSRPTGATRVAGRRVGQPAGGEPVTGQPLSLWYPLAAWRW